MKLLPIIFALLTLSASAQTEADRWKHVHQAGKDKQAAIIAMVAGTAFTSLAIAKGGWTDTSKAFALMTVGVSVGFSLSSAGHLKKAGR